MMNKLKIGLLLATLVLPGFAWADAKSNFVGQTALCDPRNGNGQKCVYPITPADMLRGANSSTSNSGVTLTGMGAQGAAIKIYITDFECYRTDAGSTITEVTLNDGATSRFAIPAGGAFSHHFNIPLVIAANTAAQFTPVASVTTMYCNAQGFKGA